MRKAGWWIGLFFVGVPVFLPAQTVTGTILGTVTDESGARMAGSAVVVINDLTKEKHTATTNAAGDYLVTALPVGPYHVDVEAQGFKKYVREGIVLEVNQNARVDAKLQIGALSQEVRISGDVTAVDTHQVQLGTVVDTKSINDLPLNGRNVYGLVTQLPGVTGTTLQTQPDVTEGNQMNLNGSRVLQTSFLLDGGLNNNVFRDGGLMAPNPDAVEEFRLITSNYNAEYGRSGGGIVNVITKSGTNQFHGTLYEFLRNSDLNARSFFNPNVSALRQNQFGGTLGGPVVRDKVFFFFSYEGLRQRAAQFMNVARTPTAAERAGDFSALAANQRPHDPDTGVVFPNGIIPTSRLDPVAANLLKTVPLPNTSDGRVQDSESQSLNNDSYLGKVDYLINQSHRLTASAFIVTTNIYNPFGVGNIQGYAPQLNTANQNNVSATDTWTISPMLLNQLLFTYTGAPATHGDSNTAGLKDWGSNINIAAQPPRPPYITVTNGWTSGTFGDLSETDQIYTIGDTLTWMHGQHAVKAGGTFQRFAFDYNSNGSASGMITDTGAFSGNSFSDLELGRVGLLLTTAFAPHLRMKNWSLFAQDDWKISRRITLNLGIRYDVFGPFTSTSSQLSNWIAGQESTKFPTAPLGMNFVGDPGVPGGLVQTRYNDFAPRVGIAIDPFGDGKTAIRAGYGIFYSVGFAGLYNANYGQPFQPSVTVVETPSLVNPIGSVTFPPAPGVVQFVTPVPVAWMNQNNVPPYVEQYNFTIDRQLMHNFRFSAAYVGNSQRHLELQRDANAPIYIPGAGKSTSANINSRRPFDPNIIGSISETESAANANYNALQMMLTRRFSRGFTLLANYTYSKALDIQSADQQSIATITFVDSNNLALDRGPASFDVRHVFNLSFVWDLPKLARWGFVGRQVLSNWQVNGIARYTSGHPFTVTTGVDTNLDGNNTDRPNLSGNPVLPTGRPTGQLLAAYFNKAAFQAAVTGTDGTAGRDILYGPGFANWDVSLFRNITLHENHRLQFRAEFFNVFNKPNFNTPVSVLSNPNVGVILSAGAGRVIQFGLKYLF